MQYVSNGLRALGRGAVVGAVALATTGTALSQDMPKAGFYRGPNHECLVRYDDGVYFDGSLVSCRIPDAEKAVRKDVYDDFVLKDGGLIGFKLNGKRLTVMPESFGFIRPELADDAKAMNIISYFDHHAAGASSAARKVVNETVKLENCVAGECKEKK